MEYRNLSIKNWAVEDRPREKLMQKGVESLSDAELLAILLVSGTKTRTALDLGKELLHRANNSLSELGKLHMEDLVKIRGIGKSRAITILAALELGRRRKFSAPSKKQQVTSSRVVFEIFQPLLGDLAHEEFWVLILNRSNRVIDKICISKGGISGTVIDTRVILNKALSRLGSAMIICHNHPSGNTDPSEADRSITRKIKNAAATMDISLLDHVIIADDRYYSFADNGDMQ